MEFSEKLQQLRKKNNLTQEQLAEKLYVSRTAVSKWERGNGYPNIDSLKNISKLFNISIDNLLSSEELIDIASSENKTNIDKFIDLIFAVFDLLNISFIFLPLYGLDSVSLIEYNEISDIRIIYYLIFIVTFILGLLELILQFKINKKVMNICKNTSIIFHSIAILFFALARQPYVTCFLFMLFMIKALILLRKNQIN